MKIRAAISEDIPTLRALIERSIRRLNAKEHSPESMELVCSLFTEERLHRDLQRRDIFIMENHELPVGTISLGEGKLHSLFVEPEHAGKGYGSRLVTHIEEFARSRKLRKLSLNASLTAIPFYEKMGYRKLNEVKVDFGSMWAMEKRP
ncbi:MAG: GNAT family N-acetyltransferase [Pseudomonadota bacterium]|nr:GNAT family N-acetyltransferase [Pseudomonadota bacterium]